VSIRRDPIYISTPVWRALRIISKAKEKTPDEIADDLLAEAIQAKFPKVVEQLSEIDKIERQLIKQIGMEGNQL
jgi:Mg2+ and Co2+ transporter CorA